LVVDEVMFRRTGNRLFLSSCVSVFALLFLGGMLASDVGETSGTIQLVVCTALFAATVVVAVRSFRQEISASGEGVTFRNVLRTHHFEWVEIVRFESSKGYGALTRTGLGARLRDGSLVTSSLYAPGPLNRVGFADHVLTTLNGLLVDRLRLDAERSRPAGD